MVGWNQVKTNRLTGPPRTLGMFSHPTVTGAWALMILLPTRTPSIPPSHSCPAVAGPYGAPKDEDGVQTHAHDVHARSRTHAHHARGHYAKIGRASARERVFTYV